MTDSSAVTAAAASDGPGDQELAAELERLERKPPLYRFFRGAMYGIYLFAALWLVSAIAWSVYQSVWGPEGEQLKSRQQAVGGVLATPLGNALKPDANTQKPNGAAPTGD